MFSRYRTVLLFPLLLLLFSSCGQSDPAPPTGKVDLSPASWPAGELEKVSELNLFQGETKYAAQGKSGLVSGTMAAPAVRAGLEALTQGGTAADAALVEE